MLSRVFWHCEQTRRNRGRAEVSLVKCLDGGAASSAGVTKTLPWGIDMDFTQAVAIFISGILSPSMVDMLMVISPGTQTCINTVFVRINKRTWRNSRFNERLDRLLLHVSNHVDDDLTTPLYHPKDGWPLFVQCATTTFAFESVSTSFSPLVLYHLRLPFMACNYIGFVALHLV